MTIRVNVIDFDIRRRARISHVLNARDAHVEIYDDVAELARDGRLSGLIFMSDEPAGTVASKIRHVRAATQAIHPVIGYSEDPQPQHVVAAVRAGAIDYLRWPFDERQLDGVLERLASGRDRFVQEEMLRSRARARVHDLSDRETDVLTQLVKGLSNKEIGRALSISHRTVEIHRANMMAKLGAQSTPDAVRIGVYAGLDELTAVENLLAVA
jgi:FixJ family two-component response regulator